MKSRNIASYRTIVFDCDGVILDSNRLKSRAFFEVGACFSPSAGLKLLNFHRTNGGISRYEKFKYFIDYILPTEGFEGALPRVCDLVARYSATIDCGLRTCDIASAIAQLAKETVSSKWAVVSGGDQYELRKLLRDRDIAGHFTAGIFGSPRSKEVIFKEELNSGNIALPAIYIGDSKYDYEASTQFGLDFLFVSDWSEFEGWHNWCTSNDITAIKNLGDLLDRYSE